MAKKQNETKSPAITAPMILSITTREEMVNGVGKVREWEIKKRKLEADKAAAVLAVEAGHAMGIDEAVQNINAWNDVIKTWCLSHREEFGGHESIDTVHGKVKLYLGAWGTKLLPRFTWDKVVKVIKSFGLDNVLLRNFDPEPDKDAMIAYRETPIPNPKNPTAPLMLEQLGVTCERGEFFEIVPKIDSVEAPAAEAKEAA
ncbi:MAG: host-nuclease inhibitor Gam family protein [Verrucomicrobia bacterium]|nr:host-nuclease inhibitor Gam family protein [Verrucomicrobiota bacterium]